MKETYFLAAMAAAGLLVGFMAFSLTGPSDGAYCDRIEQDIRANQTFNGRIACYPPGVLNVNLSDKIEENTELKCVCRKSFQDQIQYLPITVTR